jgi:hypothetical protein
VGKGERLEDAIDISASQLKDRHEFTGIPLAYIHTYIRDAGMGLNEASARSKKR